MDRAKFYTYLKSGRVKAFGTSLSQRQVDGINALLDAGDGLPLSHMANVLAQTYRETGGGMYPVKETVYRNSKDQNPSDETVIRRLDAAWAKGQLPWVKAPYWRGGWFGRGQLQVTHEDNYRKASAVIGLDLVSRPEKMLDPAISARVAVAGMSAGMFTGKRLSDYDTPKGYAHGLARAIVNGDKNKRDKGASMTIGEEIEGNALQFEAALAAAKWGMEEKPEQVIATHGFWAGLVDALIAVFGWRKRGGK